MGLYMDHITYKVFNLYISIRCGI